MGKFSRRFTDEQEKAILSLFFTNPYGDVSFIIPNRDFGPEEQAALAAKYSRDAKPYQAKFMELLDKDQNLNMDFINTLVHNPDAVDNFSIGSQSLRKDARRFHTRWSLGFTPEEKDEAVRKFGDDSIKDAANALYYAENITDNDNKIITQNPRNRPQVVSTRYLDRRKALAEIENNSDIKNSRYGEEILYIAKKLGDAYIKFTDVCADFVEDNPLNLEFRTKYWLSQSNIEKELNEWKRAELEKDPARTFSNEELEKKRRSVKEKREKDYIGYARKTVFDFTRYLLFPAIPTSMAVASDARTLEEDLTNLLSAPLSTARDLGEIILSEGRKIMPTLLGEKTHARKNEFIISLRDELSYYAKTRIEAEKNKDYESTSRTNFVDKDIPSFNDMQLAAAVVFPHSSCSLKQLYDHFAKNRDDIRYVVDTILRLRTRFDQDLPELLQGGLMRETLIDYGADRDIQRHRRGFKTRQLLTTYHGYEIPELFPIAGLDKEFSELMMECDKTFRIVVDGNKYVAQLTVPFAFKIRRLYSWQFGQDLFFSKLRSGEGGIISYRKVAWDIEDQDKERMPEFSRLFRVNRNVYPPELINLNEAKSWYNQEKKR